MSRLLLLLASIVMLHGTAQAAPVTYDIAGTAHSDNSWYGISAGDQLSGSLIIDIDVKNGKGKVGDVEAFEFRFGNTVFDTSSGKLNVSYRIVDGEMSTLKLHVWSKEFKRDFRQFVLDLTVNDLTLSAKSLGRDWVHVDNVRIEREQLYLPYEGGVGFSLAVPEPASLLIFAAAIGLLGLVARHRRA
jgi:hypothetical protein